MKLLNSIFALIGVILFFVNFSFSQKTKPQQNSNLQVALGKIYQLPEESDQLIEGANPSVTRKVFYGYIRIVEWHFEIRFTDAELKRFERILVKQWNANATARENIKSSYTYLNKLKTMSRDELSTEFYNRRSSENLDILRENDSDYTPKGLRGTYKKLAANGNEEGVFVWNKITEYETPSVKRNYFHKPLNRKHIDATTEWVAYQINVVANKEVFVLDDEKRRQMEDLLLAEWKKLTSGNGSSSDSLALTFQLNVSRWQYLRIHRGFSFDEYRTNYGKLSAMVDWAKNALYYCPSIQPYAEQRVKEYRDYAAKMSDAEWNFELNRLKSQMKMQNMAIEAMKRQQLEYHALNLNILEPSNSKYQWVIKERP